MLKLFYAPNACSLAPHIALNEAGAEYEAILVDTKAGEQRAPAYLAINPKARVPALATERGILTEVPVLLGVALGFQLGFLMHTAVLGAFFGLRGLRNERLLLKYYDACREPGLGERGVAVGEDGQP